MRWLIIEDALRNRTGHWFEYVSTFMRGLTDLGDEVELLVDEQAESFITTGLGAKSVLPPSIWHRMNDDASLPRRYLRVLEHAWLTLGRVCNWLDSSHTPDIIFVPTVLVHHLLGWVGLVKGPLRTSKVRVILFFPFAPIRFGTLSELSEWVPAPTSKLFYYLIRALKSDVESSRVILGAETQAMSIELSRLTGVTFQYFPHPVEPLPDSDPQTKDSNFKIIMASYGGARHEKGEDILIDAIEEYNRRFADSQLNFILQCVGGKREYWCRLEGHANVNLIQEYFEDGEYAGHLQSAQVLLLPYRKSSYGLRVSRVAVEAMVNGIPMITTIGSTLAGQASDFGAAVLCEDGNAESLVLAIRECELRYGDLRKVAKSRMLAARKHFSVEGFRVRVFPPTVQDEMESNEKLMEFEQ